MSHERIPLRIILKSGAEIYITVTDWEVRKHRQTQEIVEFTYTDAEPSWAYLDLTQIAAITREARPDTSAKQ